MIIDTYSLIEDYRKTGVLPLPTTSEISQIGGVVELHAYYLRLTKIAANVLAKLNSIAPADSDLGKQLRANIIRQVKQAMRTQDENNRAILFERGWILSASDPMNCEDDALPDLAIDYGLRLTANGDS